MSCRGVVWSSEQRACSADVVGASARSGRHCKHAVQGPRGSPNVAGQCFVKCVSLRDSTTVFRKLSSHPILCDVSLVPHLPEMPASLAMRKRVFFFHSLARTHTCYAVVLSNCMRCACGNDLIPLLTYRVLVTLSETTKRAEERRGCEPHPARPAICRAGQSSTRRGRQANCTAKGQRHPSRDDSPAARPGQLWRL